jgi:hypothetical protein
MTGELDKVAQANVKLAKYALSSCMFRVESLESPPGKLMCVCSGLSELQVPRERKISRVGYRQRGGWLISTSALHERRWPLVKSLAFLRK